MICDYLLITAIAVLIIDFSGVVGEIESAIARALKVGADHVHLPKPFSCSMCVAFWSCLTWSLGHGTSLLDIFLLTAVSVWGSKIIRDAMQLARDLIEYCLTKISRKL